MVGERLGMSCPFTESELEIFDGVANPMGEVCMDCEDWECEHNNNLDNPNYEPFIASGEPMSPEEFAVCNRGKAV